MPFFLSNSLSEEIDFWNYVQSNVIDVLEGRRAEAGAILKELHRVDALLTEMDKLPSLTKLLDEDFQFFDRLREVLEDLWFKTVQDDDEEIAGIYNEKQMNNLLSVLSFRVIMFLEKKVLQSSSNLWMDSYSKCRVILDDCICVCEEWDELCRRLTSDVGLFRTGSPSWKGKQHVDRHVGRMSRRFSRTLMFRTTIVQLLRHLGEAQQEDESDEDDEDDDNEEEEEETVVEMWERRMSEAFESLPVVVSGTGKKSNYIIDQQKWRYGIHLLEEKLKPLEVIVATTLQKKIRGLIQSVRERKGEMERSSVQNSPDLMRLLRFFHRNKEVLGRKVVRTQLRVERVFMFSEIEKFIMNLRSELDDERDSWDISSGVSECVFRIRAMVSKVQMCNEMLLSQKTKTKNHRGVLTQCEALLRQLSMLEKSLLDKWILNVEQTMLDHDLEDGTILKLVPIGTEEEEEEEDEEFDDSSWKREIRSGRRDNRKKKKRRRRRRMRPRDSERKRKIEKNILVVNFPNDQFVESFLQDLQILTSNPPSSSESLKKYEIPSRFYDYSQRIEALYPEFQSMTRICQYYNNEASKEVLASQSMMLVDASQEFEVSISRFLEMERKWGDLLEEEEDGFGLTRRTNIKFGSASVKRTKKKYIDELKSAQLRYMEENRKLKNVHFAISKMVMELIDTPLFENSASANISMLRKKESQSRSRSATVGGMGKWKFLVEKIREEIQFLEDLKYETDDWKLYWDHQLAKALNYQYRQGLEYLSTTTPTETSSSDEKGAEGIIKCRILLKNNRVQYLPPLEILKKQYFDALKRFIEFPKKFMGINEGIEIFREIVNTNLEPLRKVYHCSQLLFLKLERFLNILKDYIGGLMNLKIKPFVSRVSKGSSPTTTTTAPSGSGEEGNLGLDEEEEGFVMGVEDYALNFRLIRTKLRKLDHLEKIKKIDGKAVVYTEEIRREIENKLASLQDELVGGLRESTETHLQNIREFVVQHQGKVGKGAEKNITTMKDIGEMHKFCEMVKQSKVRLVEPNVRRFEKKSRLLRSVCGIDLKSECAEVMGKWNDFSDTVEVYDTLLKKRADELKLRIENKKKDIEKRITKFYERWKTLSPRQLNFEIEREQQKRDLEKQMSFVKKQRETLEEFDKEAKELIQEFEYFGIRFKKTKNKNNFLNLIEVADEEIKDFENIFGTFKEFTKELKSFGKEKWMKLKENFGVFEDFIIKWSKKVKEMESQDDNSGLRIFLIEKLDGFKKLREYLPFLLGEYWTTTHWTELFNDILRIGDEVKNLEGLRFEHLLRHAPTIMRNIGKIRDLDERARGEDQIRHALKDLELWENTFVFQLTSTVVTQTVSRGHHKDVSVPLIEGWRDISTDVSDQQALLSSLKTSSYVDHFSNEVEIWEFKLSRLDEYLANLHEIQRKWVYLAPIFGRGSLPAEQKRFENVDNVFKKIMNIVSKDPRIVKITDHDWMGNALTEALEQLEICSKALSKYLERKREAFPRFYFIDDDDLLQILGQSKNADVIQTHLKKLFGGINSVKFRKKPDKEEKKNGEESNSTIEYMCSIHGEEVKLLRPVTTCDNVEEWLSELDMQMKKTLRNLLISCQKSKVFDLDAFPQQILCLSWNIRFAKECEDAISDGTLPVFLKKMKERLELFTSIDTKDNVVKELKLKALILDLIHQIDVVENLLIRKKITSKDDWIWQKQLRYYFEKIGDNNYECCIRMYKARFEYTYEYQGNDSKLVYTPLTDKCYLTLTQAMHLGYGGNPYGPAGTGKTESVKALGVLFGRQVLVFNCDEGLDYKSMGRIFIGLVKCGAWGCFDEFNRLKEDQLSEISQQIQIIQAAIKKGGERRMQMMAVEGGGKKKKKPQDVVIKIQLLEKTIEVNPSAGIFVTLNPAGKRYGARSKLPDNLKQLFRSIAMSKPDVDIIAEVTLFSEGFLFGSYISKKIVAAYQLCSQLLSPQLHYDWGLRAMKTVLGVAGKLRKQAKQAREKNAEKIFEENEETKKIECEFIIKAMLVNTVPKLTHQDVDLFDGIVGDVFPGIEKGDIQYLKLQSCIETVLKKMNLEDIPSQITKILQFHEALAQRIGVVLVGPSGSGKSTVWRVLVDSYRMMYPKKTFKTYVMNPKSISRKQLLGYMNLDTREFFDGIITATAKKIVRENDDVEKASKDQGEEKGIDVNNNKGDVKEMTGVHSFVILDGDVDPKWIESLNSVLDDNHLLTMPTGARIKFGDDVNFIFETHSLEYASPATVSRMGMVFMSEEDVDTKGLIESWMKNNLSVMSSNEKEDGKKTKESKKRKKKKKKINTQQQYLLVKQLIEDYFLDAVNLLISEYGNDLVVETTKMGIVLGGLSQIDLNIEHKCEFMVTLIRGLGNYLNFERREKYARDIFSLFGEEETSLNLIASDKKTGLFDYSYNLGSGRFMKSKDKMKDDRNDQIFESDTLQLIETVSVQRVYHTIKKWLRNGDSFCLVGPEGCGKSSILFHCLEKEEKEREDREKKKMSKRRRKKTQKSAPEMEGNGLLGSMKKKKEIRVIHCNSQTSSKELIYKIKQNCRLVTRTGGKVLQPLQANSTLIFFLRNVNLPKPDGYGTTQLISFLQQIISYNGFYDIDNDGGSSEEEGSSGTGKIEWVTIEKGDIQFICSMNPLGASTLSGNTGRYPLTPRFTSIIRICYLDYPSKNELINIYSSIARSVLVKNKISLAGSTNPEESRGPRKRDSSEGRIEKRISKFMVDMYLQVRKKFNVDQYSHYVFTPRHLSEWIHAVGKFDIVDVSSRDEFLDVLVYEGRRKFRDRLVEETQSARDGDDDDEIFGEKNGGRRIRKKKKQSSLGYYDSLEKKLLLQHFQYESKLCGDFANYSVPVWVYSSLLDDGSDVAESESGQRLKNRRKLKKIHIRDYSKIMSGAVSTYARECRKLFLPILVEIIDYFSRIDRVISQDYGYLLLVGRAGIGRQNMVTLISSLLKFEVFSPSITGNYSRKHFRRDLKYVFNATGIEKREIVLILEDHHISSFPRFLEAVNSILSSGEVPGLYSGEELSQLLSSSSGKSSGKNAKRDDSLLENIVVEFQQRVQKNLRIVLIMDPTNPSFVSNCNSNPALFTKCSIQWKTRYSLSGMLKIPNMMIGDLLKKMNNSKKIISQFVKIHQSMGRKKIGDLQFRSLYNTVCPSHFLQFLRSFRRIFLYKNKKKSKIRDELKRGLNKIKQAEVTVEDLSKKANKQRRELAVKQIQKDKAMAQVKENMSTAAKQSLKIEKLSVQIQKDEELIKQKTKHIDAQLGRVQPTIDAAKRAVGKVKQKDLAEIITMIRPPDAVKHVLEGVCILLSANVGRDWKKITKYLRSQNIPTKIMQFDAKKHISKQMGKQIRQHLNEYGEFFEPKTIKRASKAVAPMAAWIKANIEFAAILVKVGPLERQKKKVMKAAEVIKQKMKTYQVQLDKLNVIVSSLEKNFDKKTKEAAELQFKIQVIEEKLKRAEELLNKLKDEKGRWGAQHEELNEDIKKLPQLVMLSSAFMTYLSGSSDVERKKVVEYWTKFFISPVKRVKKGVKSPPRGLQYDFIRTMVNNESDLLIYKSEGLPDDELSQENAILLLEESGSYGRKKNGKKESPENDEEEEEMYDLDEEEKKKGFQKPKEQQRVPLVIDPSAQATDWLISHFRSCEEENNRNGDDGKKNKKQEKKKVSRIEVMSAEDSKFVTKLELAVRFGKILFIKEVEKINSVLYPLLRREFINTSSSFFSDGNNDNEMSGFGKNRVMIGEKKVDCNPSFKIFLLSRNSECLSNLSPDSLPLITPVNFTVTKSGLQNQLLGITIRHEEPKIERQKIQLLKKEDMDKIELSNLEKQLLKQLSKSKGNLLENTNLISKLNEIKMKTVRLKENLETSAVLKQKIESQRNTYRPFAKTGSELFFLIKNLVKLNHMYRFSLNDFLRLYKKALRLSSGIDVIDIGDDDDDDVFGMNNKPPRKKNREKIEKDVRIGLLTQELLKVCFQFYSRSLFKNDRLPFGLYLIKGLFTKFKEKEWNLFLDKVTSLQSSKKITQSPKRRKREQQGKKKKNIPLWIPKDKVEKFQLLSSVLGESFLVNQLEIFNTSIWSDFFDSENEDLYVQFPHRIARKITPFQRILMIKSFRNDCLLSSLKKFVSQQLNIPSISDTLSFSKLYTETSCDQPILFILKGESGIDPTHEIVQLGESKKRKIVQISMGQGQQKVAILKMRECYKDQNWLILKNLHLVLNWIPELEKEISSLMNSDDDIDEVEDSESEEESEEEGKRRKKRRKKNGFRLWLTTKSHNWFPNMLLEQSLKITFESPPGVGKQLKRMYDSCFTRDMIEGKEVDQSGVNNNSTNGKVRNSINSSNSGIFAKPSFISSGGGGGKRYGNRGGGGGSRMNSKETTKMKKRIKAQLFFILAFFHAIVQERRNFIPQGWTKYYTFNFADLRSAVQIIELAINKEKKNNEDENQNKDIDWKTIHGLFENVIYGARMENLYDLEILKSYLLKYFNPDLINFSSYRKRKRSLISSGGGMEMRKSSRGKSPMVMMPSSSSFRDYLKFIEDVENLENSNSDPSTFFGLSSNANRFVSISKYEKVIEDINTLCSIVTIGGDSLQRNVLRSSSWKSEIFSLIKFWKKLMMGKEKALFQSSANDSSLFLSLRGAADTSRDGQKEEKKKKKKLDPIKGFLVLEYEVAVKLMKCIFRDLRRIENIICKKKSSSEEGGEEEEVSAELSPSLREIIAFLVVRKVPPKWDNIIYTMSDHYLPLNDVYQYLRNVVKKTLYICNVLNSCEKSEDGSCSELLEGECFKLNQFFHPEILLSSFKQYLTRRKKISLDQLDVLSCYWTENFKKNRRRKKGKDIVLSKNTKTKERKSKSTVEFLKVKGLVMQGCSFDGHMLAENQGDSPPFSSIPTCKFTWENSGGGGTKKKVDKNVLKIPVYFSTKREKVLTYVSLKVEDCHKWILCGVAMFLQT